MNKICRRLEVRHMQPIVTDELHRLSVSSVMDTTNRTVNTLNTITSGMRLFLMNTSNELTKERINRYVFLFRLVFFLTGTGHTVNVSVKGSILWCWLYCIFLPSTPHILPWRALRTAFIPMAERADDTSFTSPSDETKTEVQWAIGLDKLTTPQQRQHVPPASRKYSSKTRD